MVATPGNGRTRPERKWPARERNNSAFRRFSASAIRDRKYGLGQLVPAT